jgi:hypothetical protein
MTSSGKKYFYCCVERVHTVVKNINLGQDHVKNRRKITKYAGTAPQKIRQTGRLGTSLSPSTLSENPPMIPTFFFPNALADAAQH